MGLVLEAAHSTSPLLTGAVAVRSDRSSARDSVAGSEGSIPPSYSMLITSRTRPPATVSLAGGFKVCLGVQRSC